MSRGSCRANERCGARIPDGLGNHDPCIRPRGHWGGHAAYHNITFEAPGEGYRLKCSVCGWERKHKHWLLHRSAQGGMTSRIIWRVINQHWHRPHLAFVLRNMREWVAEKVLRLRVER